MGWYRNLKGPKDPGPTTSRFDIAARAEGDALRPLAEFRRMLRSLLTDRFQFAILRETRETPVYRLVADKTDPNFTKAHPKLSRPRTCLIQSIRADKCANDRDSLSARGLHRPNAPQGMVCRDALLR
jgi:uncharacterized protein (TIGR03435 family)